MVIHTPRLCGEPIFHGTGESDAERNAASIIRCNPIAGDGPARPAAKIDAPAPAPVAAPEPASVPAPAPEPVAPPPQVTEALQEGQAFHLALDSDKLFDPGDHLSEEELQMLEDEGLMLMVDTETGEVTVGETEAAPAPPPSPPSAAQPAKPAPGSGSDESPDKRRKKQMSVLEQISALLQESMTEALRDAQQNQGGNVAAGDTVKQLVEKLQAAGHQATILNPNAARDLLQPPPANQQVGSSRQHSLAQAYGADYGADADDGADADAREQIRRQRAHDAARRDEL